MRRVVSSSPFVGSACSGPMRAALVPRSAFAAALQVRAFYSPRRVDWTAEHPDSAREGLVSDPASPARPDTISTPSGTRKKKKRRGRGWASGLSRGGRGQKGWYARHSALPYLGYEGGQTPLHIRIPRHGLHKLLRQKPRFESVELTDIVQAVRMGRLRSDKVITTAALLHARIIPDVPQGGVRIVDSSSMDSSEPLDLAGIKMDLRVAAIDTRAQAAVEGVGGRFQSVYHTPESLRAHCFPWEFEFLPQRNGLPKRWERSAYPDYEQIAGQPQDGPTWMRQYTWESWPGLESALRKQYEGVADVNVEEKIRQHKKMYFQSTGTGF